MSTPCTISLEYADGKVRTTYCHFDGYISHAGKILRKHYTDPINLSNLINLGDIMGLETDGSPCLNEHEEFKPKNFKDYKSYLKRNKHQRYNYILRKDGKWYVVGHGIEKLLSK
jgi:hypothetical protein